jgi:hypothetical protein
MWNKADYFAWKAMGRRWKSRKRTYKTYYEKNEGLFVEVPESTLRYAKRARQQDALDVSRFRSLSHPNKHWK